MNLIIVGATGIVGREIIKLLESRDVKYNKLKLVSSKRSVGTEFIIKGTTYKVEELNEDTFLGFDCAILVASAEVSKQCVQFRDQSSNCILIDNSSAFRMDKDIPLVIPEINMDTISDQTNIISNPNCSTILMLMVLYPLHRVNKIKQIDVCTYQAASGAGLKAMEELESQVHSHVNKKEMKTECFGRQYLFNAFSHNSEIDLDSRFNGEEVKMIKETHKILSDNDIVVNPTCIRIPTLRSHLESLTIRFEEPMDPTKVLDILDRTDGVQVYDYPEENIFPEPIITEGKDDVYVGRIRQSYNKDPNVIQLILSGDQIRKGAALNAIQIYELYI
jgi:aspartate-semialdehyde dehydrogenase